MFTRTFWLGAADRAAKSAVQVLLLMWGAGQFDLLAVDWRAVAGLGGGALVLSLLTSIASAPFGDVGATSFLRGGS